MTISIPREGRWRRVGLGRGRGAGCGSGVAALPRVVILTMHDISLTVAKANQSRFGDSEGRLVLEGKVNTYRYVDEDEVAQRAAEQAP